MFVAARICTRLFRLRQRLDCSDYLLIASALDALGLIICDTLTFQMGVMDDYQSSERLSKISFASNYFYDFGLGLPKLSMLAFYWEYYKPSLNAKLRRFLQITIIFVIVCYLTTLFDDTFFCGRNVSVQWSQEAGACSVFYAREPFILNFSLGLSCYLAIYSIPVIALSWNVLPASSLRIFALILGSLPIGAGVIRFICLNVELGQENLVYILSMLELALAIIVVCIPGLKPLMETFRKGSRGL
ncbi:hypothetical protein Alg130_10105 [Pyrenophora tritici-repentis]|nr:hypothetical protein Alg130_10105 [Pyrenophora tritici-repentis]